MATHPSSPGRASPRSLDYVATLRGRIGYLSNHWMLYATGGYAARAHAILWKAPASRQIRIGRPDSRWLCARRRRRISDDRIGRRAPNISTPWGHAGAAFHRGPAFPRTDAHMLRIGLNRMVRWPGPDPESSKDWPAARFDQWNRARAIYFVIGQGYPSFRSPYEGARALQATAS